MRPAFFLFMAAIFAAALSLPVAAQARGAPGVQPLDRILPGITRTHPGRFYDADGPTQGADGAMHYHLKWMTPEGRIEWLDTDARTGRVLGTSPGRDSFDTPGTGRYYPPPPSYSGPSYPAPAYPVPEFGGGFRGSDDYGWRRGYPGGGYTGGGYAGGGHPGGGGYRGGNDPGANYPRGGGQGYGDGRNRGGERGHRGR